MRVAVCISGIINDKTANMSLQRGNEILKEKFPGADFHYATWNGYKDIFEKNFPDDTCHFFDEPEMNYHPFLDIPKEKYISTTYHQIVDFMKKDKTGNRLKWSAHHTKQLLIHSWLVDRIKDNYDVIVRTRFDIFLFKGATFTEYLNDTFINKRANCFSATKTNKTHILNEFPTSSPAPHHTKHVDMVIIHNSDVIDTDKVNNLHKEKLLHGAEFGWYQIISMDHGSRHRCYDGWAIMERKIPFELLY